MWNQLSYDLLAKIFSFLPPDSLACAASSCRDWRTCTKSHFSITHHLRGGEGARCNPPWFLAMTTPKHHGLCCFTYNSLLQRWYLLSLVFLPQPIHPISPLGSLILCRPANSSHLQLALCNPFTKQYKPLPPLNTLRTTPAVGVVWLETQDASFGFRIFVAGGMSIGSSGGGASYELTLEMYDSQLNKWQSLGFMPIEYAVRLTVWTPNESIYHMGVLYWITSARAYSIMGLDVNSCSWRKLNVPMADRLEFAALVQRKGQLTLIGGKNGEEACVWELGVGDVWVLIERVPSEIGNKFVGCKGSWCYTKCAGTDKAVYLYKDLASKMLVWMEGKGNGRWEWVCVEAASSSIRGGMQVPNFPIKGMLIHPGLGPSI